MTKLQSGAEQLSDRFANQRSRCDKRWESLFLEVCRGCKGSKYVVFGPFLEDFQGFEASFGALKADSLPFRPVFFISMASEVCAHALHLLAVDAEHHVLARVAAELRAGHQHPLVRPRTPALHHLGPLGCAEVSCVGIFVVICVFNECDKCFNWTGRPSRLEVFWAGNGLGSTVGSPKGRKE